MPCNTETTYIGDNEFSVTQWPIEKSLLMKFKLTKMFGPALTCLLGGLDVKGSDEDQITSLSNGLEKLFESGTPEDIVLIMKKSIVGIHCNEERITESSFTELFSGDNMMDVYKVFLFVLKVNYGNLLKGQKVEKLLAKIQGLN